MRHLARGLLSGSPAKLTEGPDLRPASNRRQTRVPYGHRDQVTALGADSFAVGLKLRELVAIPYLACGPVLSFAFPACFPQNLNGEVLKIYRA